MKKIILILTAFILTACGGSGRSEDLDKTVEEFKNSRQHFFKTSKASDAALVPIVGIREYDNQIKSHLFRRGCGSDEPKLYSGSSAVPLSNQELAGLFSMGPNCRIDLKLEYTAGNLRVLGTVEENNVSRDVDFDLIKISQAEFVEELNSSKIDFKGYFEKQSLFDQKNRLDQMCDELFDVECSNIF